MPEMEGLKLSLSQLLAQEPQEGQELSHQEEQEQAFLKRMRELARGLVGSEYWELLSLVLIEGLEEAKGALESETITVEQFRIRQGEAKAYRSAFNLILGLGKIVEEKNGETGD